MAEVLNPWDIVTLVIYFVIVFVVGIVATVRMHKKTVTSTRYFLAGKSMTWLPIAGSMFATNMGSGMFIGLAGAAASVGFAPVVFEWAACFTLILLGWVFVPVYMASGSNTMPEYLKKRYGGKRIRIYYAITSLVLITLAWISGELYAGNIFIDLLLKWNPYLSTCLILAITAIYTVAGGLTAVIYTDALQTIILLIGTITLSGISLYKIGGYWAMTEQFKQMLANTTHYTTNLSMEIHNVSCGITQPEETDHVLRGVNSAYPWTGLTFGLTILAIYFFCTNQVMVQRNLSAKSASHSKAACVVTSYLKLLPFILFVIPGMISRILYQDEVGCTHPDVCEKICGNRAGCSNLAYPLLVLRILPPGLKGLMLAALLAALMSSLTSIFNSASTMFTIDIWKVFRKKASDREVVNIGRICGVVMVGVAVAWLPILQATQGTSLWDYMQAITSYIVPPWVCIFLLGMFWQRTTEQGAWWGLMAGAVMGICRAGIHFSYATPGCGEEDTRPQVFTKVHYLHFAILLALVTTPITVCVSLLTKPRPPEKLYRVTWWTRKHPLEPELTDDEDCEEEIQITEKDKTDRRRKYTRMDDHVSIVEEEVTQENDQESEISNSPSTSSSTTNTDSIPQATNNSNLHTDKGSNQLLKLLEESKLTFWLCNVNAVIVMFITSVIIIYYA